MGRRPRSEVDKIRVSLRIMVSDEFRRAGQRFVSARYISQRFKVSYQTAHRLLTELEGDGFIIRRAGSGSFIAGHQNTLQSALLIFARRAKRSGSLLTRSVLMISAAVLLPAKFYRVILRGGRWSSGGREQMHGARTESMGSDRFSHPLKSFRPGPGSFPRPYKTSRPH
jgi:DNA-binding transcriptional regulator YhcF (GntR family)